jgi:hypothetical protein
MCPVFRRTISGNTPSIVDANHVVDRGAVHRLERRRNADAGTGDEQIDRPERLAEFAEGRQRLLTIGDVGDGDRGANPLGATLGGQRLELVASSGNEADVTFLGRQLADDLPADAARRSRDDGDLVGETHDGPRRFRRMGLRPVPRSQRTMTFACSSGGRVGDPSYGRRACGKTRSSPFDGREQAGKLAPRESRSPQAVA